MNDSIKIAIASGKGGTGKTLIATCLYHVLQSSGFITTLVDCDAEEPNDMLFFKGSATYCANVTKAVPDFNLDNCNFCGKCSQYCTYNAILMIPSAGIIKVYEELCHDCGACLVACERNAITYRHVFEGKTTKYILDKSIPDVNDYALNRIIEAKTCTRTYSPVSVIKNALNQLPDNGIIILDSPPGTSCPFIHTVLAADHVILVAEPTPFGLSDLKQSIATLRELNKSLSVIINKAGIGNFEIYNYLDDENIKLLLEIPFDKKIALNYSNGIVTTVDHPELFTRLLEMTKYILDTYGNSDNKR